MHTKVHPQGVPSSSSSSSEGCYLTSNQETFTIWMKSLVLTCKGFTVFDSSGHVVFRVDNYKCSRITKVHLMDSKGRVLFCMLKKRFGWFGLWDGYRPTRTAETLDKTKPWFQVKKTLGMIMRRHPTCDVVFGADENQRRLCKMGSWTDNKSACKIVDKAGVLIAEVKRKKSTCGVLLGEDVLTMVVEPYIDHSLVMGLIIVYSLISNKL